LPSEPLWLEGDPHRLTQVTANLLNNAAKYTPSGGRISVVAEREGGDVVLRVRDNGTGIPAALLPRIFDLFSQGDQSLARTQGGLGVGLTMVRHLVAHHGGTVRASSAGPGQGSEFTVRFPGLATETQPTQAADRPPEEPRAARALRVLLVEDNQDAADTLATLLTLWGHEVKVAYSGDQALEEAGGFASEVAILDIGLPEMDGIQLAHALRERGCLSETCVLVALTGYGDEETRRRTEEAGFHHHLTKAGELAELAGLLGDVEARES
jgi:CheY-like chemotaxis protein